MVTVRSIAQAAGVSRGTVDRVLHERGSVNPEVALRVRALSRELGYVPPRGGRSGESGHGKFRIGVLVPSIGNLFFDEVLEGVYQGSAEFADIEIEVRKLQGFEPDDHVRAIRELLEAGCQAMCLTTVSDDKVRAVLEELSQKGIRVVLMNTCVEKVPAVCYVGSDYRKSGRTCAGMLAMMQPPKPVRLLVAVGSRKVPGHMQRLEGFMEEIKRLGVPCEVSAVVETGDSDIRGQQVTTESLAADSSINCVYVTGAGIQGVGAALIASGRKDIIGIAFDDIYTTRELVRAGILKFVVCQQPQRQGYHAIKRAYHSLLGIIGSKVEDFITDTIIKIESNL